MNCQTHRETKLITPLFQHNHSVEEYKSDVYELKTKCKTVAMRSQDNLRQVFDETTRIDPRACEVSFTECESAMYRARRKLQPKIPLGASEFCEMISTTSFGKFYQFSVTCGTDTAAIFFSEEMNILLHQVVHIQFDGTFYTVPIQFAQLWTIFVAVDRHSLPAIHCLMTTKSQALYIAVLERISSKVPHFKPSASMSDWEIAPRNALKEVFLKLESMVVGFIIRSVFGGRHIN